MPKMKGITHGGVMLVLTENALVNTERVILLFQIERSVYWRQSEKIRIYASTSLCISSESSLRYSFSSSLELSKALSWWQLGSQWYYYHYYYNRYWYYCRYYHNCHSLVRNIWRVEVPLEGRSTAMHSKIATNQPHQPKNTTTPMVRKLAMGAHWAILG